MSQRFGRSRIRLVALLAAMVLLISVGGTASANSSTQVIVSVTNVSTDVGPAGFWIWSQPGGNAYGNEGAGSIYFYALGIVEPVDAENVVVIGNTVTEDVSGAGGVNCHISATETAPGRGTVTFSCASPLVSATTATGQVNISH